MLPTSQTPGGEGAAPPQTLPAVRLAFLDCRLCGGMPTDVSTNLAVDWITVRLSQLRQNVIRWPNHFQSNFKMDSHVHYIISQCAQRMYLLKLLRHQGMSGEQLSVVTYSIIVSRILSILPAWGGFLSAELTNKINAFLGASSDLVTRLAILQCQIW